MDEIDLTVYVGFSMGCSGSRTDVCSIDRVGQEAPLPTDEAGFADMSDTTVGTRSLYFDRLGRFVQQNGAVGPLQVISPLLAQI